MPNHRLRKAKVGVLVVVILMFSIVLFVGSLFWLVVYGPWNENQGSNQVFTSNVKDETTIMDNYEPKSIEEALIDLREANCRVYSRQVDQRDRRMVYVCYNDFREYAIMNSIVTLSKSISGRSILLVVERDIIWVWTPYAVDY
jgi:hypothetical protein